MKTFMIIMGFLWVLAYVICMEWYDLLLSQMWILASYFYKEG